MIGVVVGASLGALITIIALAKTSPRKRPEPGKPVVCASARQSIVQATERWMSTPHQIDRVAIASVPSTMPAKIAPHTSATGLLKWIMQYGTTITKIA
jgi:hypothetical protein